MLAIEVDSFVIYATVVTDEKTFDLIFRFPEKLLGRDSLSFAGHE